MSTDFTTRVLVGDDVTPPSIPADVVATPVATTQIDLSWSASTDDYILSGYSIYRDDVEIASTTVTSYSDTGLSEGTEYSYYIIAYDSFNNRSASSSVVSTTTLVTPVVATTSSTTIDRGNTTGTRLGAFDVSLLSLGIVAERDRAVITYETDEYARGEGQWGRTPEYEIGINVEDTYTKSHVLVIDNLMPRTRYYISIAVKNIYGDRVVLYTGSFMTRAEDEDTPPSNVTNLRAERDGNDVVLTWDNPLDADFDHVRVLQSDIFYPSDVSDGWLVYEGDGEEARDTDIFKDEKRYFYTVFSYDTEGNVSSGAIVSIDPLTGEVTEDLDSTLNEINITFDEVLFHQDGVLYQGTDGRVSIDATRQLRISIPSSRLPLHLKTVMVILHSTIDEDKTFRFLLRLNSERTLYTSIVAPLSIAGDYKMEVAVFDYATGQIGYTSGVLSAYVESTGSTGSLGEEILVGITRAVSSPSFGYSVAVFVLLGILAFYVRSLFVSFHGKSL